MIIYPDSDFDSWISEDDAGTYFETRLNADPWDVCSNREAALITAFHSLDELEITIDPTDTTQLDALQRAQCEQCLHELRNDLDGSAISSFNLGSLLSVKLPESKVPPSRYSQRVLSILRPYITAPSIKRTR